MQFWLTQTKEAAVVQMNETKLRDVMRTVYSAAIYAVEPHAIGEAKTPAVLAAAAQLAKAVLKPIMAGQFEITEG